MTLIGIVKHTQSSQNSKVTMPLQYIKKEVRKGVHFQLADEHQSFLQVDFNTLGIKDAYKVILSLLLGMIKHSQSTQSNKFAISLQYLKKVRKGVHFLYADEHQSFYKLGLFFLMEVTRHVQSTQNRKLVIFLQSVAAAFVFYCNAKHSDILRGSRQTQTDQKFSAWTSQYNN